MPQGPTHEGPQIQETGERPKQPIKFTTIALSSNNPLSDALRERIGAFIQRQSESTLAAISREANQPLSPETEELGQAAANHELAWRGFLWKMGMLPPDLEPAIPLAHADEGLLSVAMNASGEVVGIATSALTYKTDKSLPPDISQLYVGVEVPDYTHRGIAQVLTLLRNKVLHYTTGVTSYQTSLWEGSEGMYRDAGYQVEVDQSTMTGLLGELNNQPQHRVYLDESTLSALCQKYGLDQNIDPIATSPTLNL